MTDEQQPAAGKPAIKGIKLTTIIDDDSNVIVDLGTQVAFISLTPEKTIAFGRHLIKRGREAQKRKKS